MTRARRKPIDGAEYPVCDANGNLYDWFLDGVLEWEKKGCQEDDLGKEVGKQMRKVARRGALPKPAG